MQEDLRIGKQWVINEVQFQARDLGLEVVLQWGTDTGQSKYLQAEGNHEQHYVLIRVGDKTNDTLFFRRIELAFCPTDPEIQKELKHRIYKHLKSMVGSGKRIGF